MIVSKILYSVGTTLEREILFHNWVMGEINRLNRRFSGEAIREWDNIGEGVFGEFLYEFVIESWKDYVLTN